MQIAKICNRKEIGRTVGRSLSNLADWNFIRRKLDIAYALRERGLLEKQTACVRNESAQDSKRWRGKLFSPSAKERKKEMRFEITYNDSWSDCDTICAEEDKWFSVPSFDGCSGRCGGGEILDDDDDVIEDDIVLYRNVTYVLRGDTLYAVVGRGRRRREIPWQEYNPEY